MLSDVRTTLRPMARYEKNMLQALYRYYGVPYCHSYRFEIACYLVYQPANSKNYTMPQTGTNAGYGICPTPPSLA